MRKLIGLCVFLVLAGSACTFGVTKAQFRPVLNEAGEPVGCAGEIQTGKEYAKFHLKIKADSTFCSVSVKAESVEAFEGQKAAAQAASEVTGNIVEGLVKGLVPSPP